MANGRRKTNTAERNEEDCGSSYLSSTTLKWAVSQTMDLSGNNVGEITERRQSSIFLGILMKGQTQGSNEINVTVSNIWEVSKDNET